MTVIYDSDAAQHVTSDRAFLQRSADKQIVLNIDKCLFFQSTVTFAGFQLSSNGNQVDKSITDAIASFPTPNNRTDLRSFFGLANQLSTSTNIISSLLTPVRPLLSTKNDIKVLESLVSFHPRKAQDSRICEWPGKKCLRSCLKP